LETSFSYPISREIIRVPPSGGSLGIGNIIDDANTPRLVLDVPPSGGSLGIGNIEAPTAVDVTKSPVFPLRGDP